MKDKKEKYLSHLKEIYSKQTSKRKIDYIIHNFSSLINGLDPKTTSILEIGPGFGEFINYLNKLNFKNIDVIDNDKEILNFTKNTYSICNTFLNEDIKKIDSRLGNYNVIILIQVLEHFPPDRYIQIMRVLYKHLKKAGCIIIVVPNANNPLGIVERYADLQHYNSFTERSLYDLVSYSGIKNYSLQIRGYEIPPFGPINLLRKIIQKALHLVLLLLLIANGGVYFKILTPNITLLIRKN